ncbi:MAG TPA: TAT-variant-translocated molybdopterin oxidoreductase [Candidatus Limnocylindrales bacterium]|nr:TAT-variant-translocated molybdopterin oxidoreductase [Candidatus Limnocylindrales bacterium]
MKIGIDPEAPAFDLAAVRERLARSTGRSYWRSLEEVADTPEFQAFLHAEFPTSAETLTSSLDRRQFLKLMGASLALAGIGACTKQPVEKILPYVKQPEELIPGKPLFFATAFPLSGGAIPVLAESHMGRPTKIEGNPEHPASLGRTSALMQASVLDLYDPDRSQVLLRAGEIRTWDDLVSELTAQVAQWKATQGKGLRILTPPTFSPTFAAAMQAALATLPQARWHRWEPVGRENVREGARLAFGRVVDARYDVAKADVIVSLESDFLFEGPGQIRYARDFASRRKVTGKASRMNRLYVAESVPTVTGGNADHRLPLRSARIAALARALAIEVGVGVARPKGLEAHEAWIKAAAQDLRDHRGASIIMAGPSQPPEVHALCHAINEKLGNAGRTVVYAEPLEDVPPGPRDGIVDLVSDINAGRVDALIMLGGNPVYDAPADLGFGGALEKLPFTLHLSSHQDETSILSLWHVPAAHYLESWGDVRAYDGTVTILQPLIEPLYHGKTALEVLSVLTGDTARTDYDRVRDHWKKNATGDFEKLWQRSVHDGFITGSQRPALTISAAADVFTHLASLPAGSDAEEGIEIAFRPDPSAYDGRFANNAWLQELPKPWTKMTWDNPALVSPALAEKMKIANGDMIEISVGDTRLQMAAWIQPGMAENSIGLHLGYGRERAGQVGTAVGFNTYMLRSSKTPWFVENASIRKTGSTYPLATTQTHHSLEGRDMFRTASFATFQEHPTFAQHKHHGIDENASFYPDWKYEGNAWGMTIDLATCIGCNACVLACQSENNIPVVGKEQVLVGREMHWIRVDRYFEGDLDNPELYNQPVPCMHCEKAPCEVVCPVNATVHSSEGLNDMVYNRCVGTRYCGNNCPYKVRRFNFHLYQDWTTESTKLQRNPDVTVRSRGVMEKCTYCVQRINQARIQARKEDRYVRDGEVVTACQGACPTDAIIFGNINDPDSAVAKSKADSRNYAMLSELGTKPRTTYLASVTNPHPSLAKPDPHAAGHDQYDAKGAHQDTHGGREHGRPVDGQGGTHGAGEDEAVHREPAGRVERGQD